MDINAMKLKRIVAHFADDGEATPKALAEILKAKPENTAFIRGYVEAAVRENKQPELLVDFDANVAKGTTEFEDAVTVTPKKAAPTSAPPAANVIDSVSESEVVANSVRRDQTAAMPGTPQPFQGFSFRYRGKDGVAVPLQVLAVKGSTVILEATPAKAPDEIVTVTLKGQPASINLTELRAKAAGDEVAVNGNTYLVATLLVIADAAKN